MFLKLLIVFFTLLQNQDLIKTRAEQIAEAQKLSNLSYLITFLSISLIAIMLLLIINLYKNYKLRTKIRSLEAKINL